MGAGDVAACRSLHADRAGSARLRRQRQACRCLRVRRTRLRHAGASRCAWYRKAGVIGHDIGGATMQPMARKAPERIAGLFFFDCVYPGIGARMGTPDRLNEIWYQSFHQTEMAPALVGATRETCRLYIEYFLRHWSHRKAAFDDVLDAFVDNFLKPGNLAGGFAHYRGAHAGRIAIMKGEAPPLPKISVKTCVRWGKHDRSCFPSGPTNSARRSRISISRFFPMSVTSRIAKILIAPRRRSPVSSSASAGGEWRGLFASCRAICV